MNIAIEALDALGLALAEHDHHWTDHERRLYEAAISASSSGCMETGLSASGMFPARMLETGSTLRSDPSSNQ